MKMKYASAAKNNTITPYMGHFFSLRVHHAAEIRNKIVTGRAAIVT